MKHLFALAAVLFLTFAATSVPASAGGALDPSGDGLNACSADDCRVCNNNGLMCTPTDKGCNCEYWDQVE